MVQTRTGSLLRRVYVVGVGMTKVSIIIMLFYLSI